MGKRLFVSVDLDGLDAEIRQVQQLFEGASGLNFVEPTQAHLTLKFLGDTDPNRVPELLDGVQTAVASAGVDPFEATFGGLGVFPSRSYISVVWLGVRAGTEELTALAEAIESKTVELGFEPADHDFTPHVTLARMNHAGGKAQVQDVLRERDPEAGTLTVEEIRLTESALTAEGPEYTTVESIPL